MKKSLSVLVFLSLIGSSVFAVDDPTHYTVTPAPLPTPTSTSAYNTSQPFCQSANFAGTENFGITQSFNNSNAYNNTTPFSSSKSFSASSTQGFSSSSAYNNTTPFNSTKGYNYSVNFCPTSTPKPTQPAVQSEWAKHKPYFLGIIGANIAAVAAMGAYYICGYRRKTEDDMYLQSLGEWLVNDQTKTDTNRDDLISLKAFF